MPITARRAESRIDNRAAPAFEALTVNGYCFRAMSDRAPALTAIVRHATEM